MELGGTGSQMLKHYCLGSHSTESCSLSAFSRLVIPSCIGVRSKESCDTAELGERFRTGPR